MADEKSIMIVDNHVTNSASESGRADSIIKEVPQNRWISYIWDALDKFPEERRFLFKLDAVILNWVNINGRNEANFMMERWSWHENRILIEISRSEQHQQRPEFWHVSIFRWARERNWSCTYALQEGRPPYIGNPVELHGDCLDHWICAWGDPW